MVFHQSYVLFTIGISMTDEYSALESCENI